MVKIRAISQLQISSLHEEIVFDSDDDCPSGIGFSNALHDCEYPVDNSSISSITRLFDVVEKKTTRR